MLEYCVRNNNWALFARMRLGKTRVTIWSAQRRNWKRCLVITAGRSTLIPWCQQLADEGETFVPDYEVTKAGSVAERSMAAEFVFDHDCQSRLWFLINCEALANSDIPNLPWDLVVFDESVAISNPRAAITKLCTKGFRYAKSRAILSGLPAPESPLQFFTQFQFLDGEAFGYKSFWPWRADNFFQNEVGEWVPKKGVNAAIKEYVHARAYVLNREDVGIGSKKMYEARYVAMPVELRKLYSRVKNEFAYSDNLETNWEVVVQTWLARICGGFDPEGNLISRHKLEELASLLNGDLRNEQTVVWFRFDAEVKEAAKDFPQAGVITGAVPFSERLRLNKQFLAGDLRLLFCQAKCARRALDFSSANTAIYYSNWWDLDTRDQSEDRTINPGKKTPQLIMDLITERTIEGKIVNRLRDKSFTSKLMMRDLRSELSDRTT